MPDKKRTSKSTRRPAKKTSTLSNIQIAAIIVIAAVVIGLIYVIVSSQKPPAAATGAASQATVASQSQNTAPTSKAPKAAAKQWSSAPPMTIDKGKQYSATIKMAKGGEFMIQLYADKAPITVNSFVFLARQGFFDGTTFHRVLEGFMAQGGDPTGTGMGGPGYQFVNENSDLIFDKAGVVAMANAGPDTNGSQFFITFGPTQQLNGGYTIFGQVTSGMDVVNGIKRRDPQANPGFTGDVIQSITITEK